VTTSSVVFRGSSSLPKLPLGWSETRLDHVASVHARIGWKALTADEYVSDGYVFLATPNIKSENIDFENVNYISEFRYDESPELQLQLGDVLLTKDGATLGITNVVRQLMRPATVNGSIAVIRPHDVDSRYLRYFLSSDVIQGLIDAMKNGMGVPHLFQADLKRFPIARPPLSHQRTIADFLDAETVRVDNLITKKRRMIELLQDRRQVLIIYGVSGQLQSRGKELVASPLPWLDRQPSHWRIAKLTLIARLGSGHTPSRAHPEWWENCAIPWITTGEVMQMRGDRIEYISQTRENISEAGLANSAAVLHPAGTVVLSRTASAGFSAIMGIDMATSQDFVTWTCGPLLEPRFLLLTLRAMRSDLLGRLAQGSTHKTIYMPDIESIRVPVPPIEEQRDVVDKVWRSLGPIDETIVGLTQQIALLREHRQALITAAVTGRLTIPGRAA
jgi:type I restriction enzyme S subunit